MEIDRKTFPEYIKQLRKSKKLNTKDLGDILGVSGRTIENWEQGKKPATALIGFINLLR